VPGAARTVRKEWAAEWDLTDEVWKTPRWVTIEEFRPDGKLLVSEMRNPDGSVCRSVNSYDDAGLLTATEFQNGDTSSTSVNFYDDRGRLIRQVDHAPDGSERVGAEYVYAADGSYTRVMYLPHMEGNVMYCSFIEDIDYSFSAPGTTTMTSAFDRQGRASELLVKDAEGSVVRRLVVTRDEAGRLVKDELFLGDLPLEPNIPMFGAGASFITTEYTYDERGRRVDMVRRMFDLSEQRETTQYDDRGNWTKTTSETDHREAQVHDEGAVELGAATVNRQQSRCTHTFDARGNWTERVTSQRYGENPDFTPVSMERREIVYYEETGE
jgi:hypothetical protein